MMATKRARISCVNKTNRADPHDRIHSVGGYTDKPWKISQTEAVRLIESGEWSFYTDEGGRTAEVIVATHNGNKYLKTQADGLHPDNLLALKECP
jgi:hypothetical protein